MFVSETPLLQQCSRKYHDHSVQVAVRVVGWMEISDIYPTTQTAYRELGLQAANVPSAGINRFTLSTGAG